MARAAALLLQLPLRALGARTIFMASSAGGNQNKKLMGDTIKEKSPHDFIILGPGPLEIAEIRSLRHEPT
jgi:nucleoside phosphorylase